MSFSSQGSFQSLLTAVLLSVLAGLACQPLAHLRLSQWQSPLGRWFIHTRTQPLVASHVSFLGSSSAGDNGIVVTSGVAYHRPQYLSFLQRRGCTDSIRAIPCVFATARSSGYCGLLVSLFNQRAPCLVSSAVTADCCQRSIDKGPVRRVSQQRRARLDASASLFVMAAFASFPARVLLRCSLGLHH